MPVQVQPIIGEWYKTAQGEQFEVVALDDDAETVEVQYFDGAVAEFETEVWQSMALVAIAPPEDWSGGYGQEGEAEEGLAGLSVDREEWNGATDMDSFE